MNVSITPELESFVQECVATGRYNNASEAIRAGLRLLQEAEADYQRKCAELKVEIEKGMKGSFKKVDFDKIKRKARAKWEAEQRTS
ncbi:type II toxin-antitoxin system ParD family antitoxin [Tunicatimonas pelagia]|uniref:type II toxin-antitoxin system ParD family antitoxin n=1 Tax=Tunicatimonas pelagia TaxID=931531 RepID=UPI002666F570|nr:type II toxin-antitoxin system ParD family antitoxin [Tunicatimonas pelagia]WKN45885.1 type II toxin-antitoxin system ParD family antitoxin [Tunicatimonas pelagia]